MTAVAPRIISIGIPLLGIESLQSKWHRRDWHFRLIVLALAAVASENAEFIGRVNALMPAMSKDKTLEKPLRDQARALERDMVQALGHRAIIQLRYPPKETTVRCDKIIAYQVMDGDLWEIRTRAVP